MSNLKIVGLPRTAPAHVLAQANPLARAAIAKGQALSDRLGGRAVAGTIPAAALKNPLIRDALGIKADETQIGPNSFFRLYRSEQAPGHHISADSYAPTLSAKEQRELDAIEYHSLSHPARAALGRSDPARFARLRAAFYAQTNGGVDPFLDAHAARGGRRYNPHGGGGGEAA
ncbi:MAG TPA: hypothetical protein VGJ84_21885 [Polyangiaceae bacterium]